MCAPPPYSCIHLVIPTGSSPRVVYTKSNVFLALGFTAASLTGCTQKNDEKKYLLFWDRIKKLKETNSEVSKTFYFT